VSRDRPDVHPLGPRGESFALAREPGFALGLHRWLPAGGEAARAGLLVAHGMAEHGRRYRELAEHFAGRGLAVYAVDLRGHGSSVDARHPPGHLGSAPAGRPGTPRAGPSGWERVLADLDAMRAELARRHGDVPLAVYGHSMGSFLVLDWIQRAAPPLAGAVLSGTGGPFARWLLAAASACLGVTVRALPPTRPEVGLHALGSLVANLRFPRSESRAAWLTRDAGARREFLADPECGHPLSRASWLELVGALRRIHAPRSLASVPPSLPVLIVGGDADPLGERGRDPRRLAKRLRRAGVACELALYPGGRHEMHLETNRRQVFADVERWLESALEPAAPPAARP